ncbi:DUF6127 family protein [uncultured Paracoccus sp.]|uniref:DUF6127 family protein n=1 Tax=uncultured Paracoccus sp. TaxID=189685 RepID=UPI003458FE48
MDLVNARRKRADSVDRSIRSGLQRPVRDDPDGPFTRPAHQGVRVAFEAALDIRDLRSLVDCIRLVRRTAMQTAVRMITTGVMLALLAGIAIKLKIFRGGP